jgi:dipeptidyl aminopeptidase/acylaminoacyl peptidase
MAVRAGTGRVAYCVSNVGHRIASFGTDLMRALEPEDVLRLRQVTAAELSPDGSRVAYVVRQPDADRNTYASSIWLLDPATGATQRITSGAHLDATPRWSPDGSWLAFTSDRGTPSAQNLFVVCVDNPDELIQLTAFEEDVVTSFVYPVTESIVWSPDGGSICFAARDPVDPTRERRASVFETPRYKSAEYGWLDGRRMHLWLAPTRGGAVGQLTAGDWDDSQPTFSPDGSQVAFVSNRSGGNTAGPGSAAGIWLVSVESPDQLRPVGGGAGPTWAPSFSPDGRTIAYFGHHDPSAGYAKNVRLWRASVVGASDELDLLADWDFTAAPIVMSDVHHVFAPSPAHWTSDGRRLFFLGSVRGTTNIFEVDVAEQRVRQLTHGDHEVISASFDQARVSFAALVSDERSPADVFVGRVEDPRLTRASDVNADVLADVFRSRATSLTYVGPSGQEIEAFVLIPHESVGTKNLPAVVEILPGTHFAHGHSFNFEYQMLAGAGFVVLHPNPPGAGSYGEAFSMAAPGTRFGEGHLDLIAGCDVLVASGLADGARLGITGDAAGGGMTNWTIGHSDRFKAAIARRSISDQISMFGTSDRGASASTMMLHDFDFLDPYSRPDVYLRESPMAYAANVTTPLLLIHSEGDMREPIGQAEEMYVALKYFQRRARLMVFHNSIHFLSRMGQPADRLLFFSAIRDWFETELGRMGTSPSHPVDGHSTEGGIE